MIGLETFLIVLAIVVGSAGFVVAIWSLSGGGRNEY